ncbi:glutathione S-transferase family protein [Tardiphaga alba]|uniref:Glutathione S-transferase family protein n=1 Tax=Tardiphaga alba TaxID=340268 RepID=A0ABX8A6V8_9BRAD|nr:glutathione S-transferase family protein [Tardiphaga alba]QUS38756.1 glutathione S-transferase family protein [Tardiphaga alba]
MSLTLHFHPLSSYCWKTLIALYENDTPFVPRIVNLGDPAQRYAHLALWPVGKFPVLQDDARGDIVPEATIIIDYLDSHYPGATRFIPEGDLGLKTRLRDRFFDLHLHAHMQKIIDDRLRPADVKDPHGVAEAKTKLGIAYDMIERDMADGPWAMARAFTLADCAALPPLYYANKVLPFADTHPRAFAYLQRLQARPSIARVLREAEPYLGMFPQE